MYNLWHLFDLDVFLSDNHSCVVECLTTHSQHLQENANTYIYMYMYLPYGYLINFRFGRRFLREGRRGEPWQLRSCSSWDTS